MCITGESCGGFIGLVCIDDLAAVEYSKTADAMLKF